MIRLNSVFRCASVLRPYRAIFRNIPSLFVRFWISLIYMSTIDCICIAHTRAHLIGPFIYIFIDDELARACSACVSMFLGHCLLNDFIWRHGVRLRYIKIWRRGLFHQDSEIMSELNKIVQGRHRNSKNSASNSSFSSNSWKWSFKMAWQRVRQCF